MRLAVHSAMLAGLTPREAADLAAAHGYAGICLLLTSDAHLQDLHSAIRVTGMAFGADDHVDVDPERAVAIATRVGAEYVGVFGAPMRGSTYQAAYDATVQRCATYARAARHSGLKVLLHQRWGTVTASASQLHRVLSNFDPREVGCVYDAGSMTIEGYEEYRIGLEVLGPYVADVHIANTRHFPSDTGTVWEWEWSPLSDGLIDLQRLFRALRRTGYDGWITLADRTQGPAAATLLDADRQMLQQAMEDMEGVGSHNPCRPLDDHVPHDERPDRLLAGAHA